MCPIAPSTIRHCHVSSTPEQNAKERIVTNEECFAIWAPPQSYCMSQPIGSLIGTQASIELSHEVPPGQSASSWQPPPPSPGSLGAQ